MTPDLAWRWEIAPGGTVYTFYLRPEARYHDGTPVTAEDVRFRLEWLRAFALGQALLGQVTEVRAPNRHTVVITLERPQASLLSYVALEAMAIAPDVTNVLPGSGPFRPTTQSFTDRWDLVRNSEYYLPTRPYLGAMTFQGVPDSAARLAALRTGQADIVGLPEGLSLEEAATLGNAPGVILDRASSLSHYAFIMNVRFPPWNDVRLRLAASNAIDYAAFSRFAQPLGGRPGTLLAPGTPWAANAPPKRDLARARQTLASVPMNREVKARMFAPTGSLTQEIAFTLKAQLGEAGIELEPLMFGEEQTLEMVRRSAFQSALLLLAAPVADPDYLLGRRYVTGGVENYSKYTSPAVDELFRRQGLPNGAASRRDLVVQLEQWIMDDAPSVVLWWQDRVVARSSLVRNFQLGPGLQTNLSFQDVWLE
ncbi:MAG: hypothetical protein HYY01_09425 [Chloroflexi bacterium]|nr:hypothetical protein [Chloroflexota bacterium]